MENTPAHFLVRGRIAGKKKKTSLVNSVVFGTILTGWFLYVPVKSLIVDDSDLKTCGLSTWTKQHEELNLHKRDG